MKNDPYNEIIERPEPDNPPPESRTKINTGGPAFPLHYEVTKKSEMVVSYDGMTLRDYFAGQALSGYCSLIDWVKDGNTEYFAEWAYKAADAMIKARE